MKEVTITNQKITAVISEQAAEVISLKRNDLGIEMIWCRNPEYWFNCNPILFPYTGPLIDGKYEYKGNVYELGQHGFARRARFTFEEVTEDSATLSLTYSEDTLKVYPFRFRLSVRYTLDEYRLNLSYKVENLDAEDLPFEIGFHPAFNCPFTPGKKYEDYEIVFEKEECLKGERRDGIVIPDGKGFPLEGNLVGGSFFYHNNQIKSDWVELTDHVHTLRVGKENFATIGFWKPKEDAPFMCIEPWSFNNDLRKEAFFRPDTPVSMLPSGETFECAYYFELTE